MKAESSGHVNRKQLLVGASGALIGGVLLAQETAARTAASPPRAFSAAASNVAVGVVERVEPPRLYLRRADDSITVEFADDSVFQRDHPVTLAEFTAGDEVVAEGEWVDGSFLGRSLSNVSHLLEGSITEEARDRIRTSAGVVLITPDTRYLVGRELVADRPAHMEVGSGIAALGRRTPGGDLVGLVITRS
jgi:hypothetical protein